MKRDWSLLRRQMLTIEALEPNKKFYPFEHGAGDWDSPDGRRYDYHLDLLSQAGWARLIGVEPFGSTWVLTFEGQEFLNMVRDEYVLEVMMVQKAESVGVGLTADLIRYFHMERMRSS
jgi:hypothetical protein